MRKRAGLTGFLATVGVLLAAVPAEAARYWLIRPVSASPELWVGATPGSSVASLAVPTGGNLGQHWTFIGGNYTTKNLLMKNRRTGTCLAKNYIRNNQPVVLQRCDAGGYGPATWRLLPPNGTQPLAATDSRTGFRIEASPPANMCLGVPYFQYRAGTQLQIYRCSSSRNQLWALTSFQDT